jgi:hypothetical protein
MPCISKSPTKRAAAAAEEARRKVAPRPLDNWERGKADERLRLDGYPEVFVDDDVRMEVLIKIGLRKAENNQ